MYDPKWYDQLAHGPTSEERKAAAENMHRRLMTCGLDHSTAFDLAWYHPDWYPGDWYTDEDL